MSHVKHYVGFDLGTKCGVCTTTVNYDSGSVIHFPREWRLSSHKQQRHIEFDAELNDLLGWFKEQKEEENNRVVVCYEKVQRHMGTSAAHVYGAYEMQLLVKCHSFDLQTLSVGVSELKKFATGKGTASKEDMITEALEASLEEALTDNEADAFWISEWARCNDPLGEV